MRLSINIQLIILFLCVFHYVHLSNICYYLTSHYPHMNSVSQTWDAACLGKAPVGPGRFVCLPRPQALSELMRCIALARICYGGHHWKMAEAHVNLAEGYHQLKGFSLQAQQHAEKAKEILLASSPIPSSDSEQRMDILKCSVAIFHTLGRSLTALHKYPFSRNLIKAQKLSEELLQNDHMPQDKWMEIKAGGRACQKRSEDAILCYQKALSYIEKCKGETSLECIPVHKKMAGVAQVLGDHATAIQHLSHFIALRKSPSSGEAAETAHLLAQAAVASKQSEHKDLAEKYFQESINAFQEAEGMESTKCLGAVDDFCQFLIATGQQERAAIMLKGSLEAKISLCGDLSPEEAETYWLLGGTELAQGHTHLAYKKLKKSMAPLKLFPKGEGESKKKGGKLQGAALELQGDGEAA
uniref:Tetratricopeptide repeat domain 23 n=1 Tax=Terrapene triunguis TaxID=2587831 RepID=A0A674IHV6_9SAUR